MSEVFPVGVKILKSGQKWTFTGLTPSNTLAWQTLHAPASASADPTSPNLSLLTPNWSIEKEFSIARREHEHDV
jgi:hypothetical protein